MFCKLTVFSRSAHTLLRKKEVNQSCLNFQTNSEHLQDLYSHFPHTYIVSLIQENTKIYKDYNIDSSNTFLSNQTVMATL